MICSHKSKTKVAELNNSMSLESRDPDQQDTQVKSRSKYSNVFKDFVDGSSAGGVNKVFSTKPVLLRLIWTILCIVCYGVMIYMSYGLIVTFNGNPTSTYVDVTVEQDINFPAVTICNLNKFRRSQIDKLGSVSKLLQSYRENKSTFVTDDETGKEQNWKDTDERREFFLKRMQARSGVSVGNLPNGSESVVDPSEMLQSLVLQASAKHPMKHLIETGHQFRNMIANCRWMGLQCNDDNLQNLWKHHWNWKYGNCYTFNFGLSPDNSFVTPLKTTKAGPNFGLKFDLFLEQHEYIPELSEEAGIKVVIGAQKQYPFPYNEGMDMPPGSSTTIALRMELIEKVDQFGNNSCVDKAKMENIYSTDGLYDYTVQSCLDTCLVQQQRRECNCTDSQYPTSNGRICFSKEDQQCVLDVQIKYKNNNYDCSTICPQRCRSISYRTTMSNAQMSNQYQQKIRDQLGKDEKFKAYVQTEANFKQDFLRIKIYFEELNMVRIHEAFSYPMTNLLADIGGQLGLWVGLSVITVAELGDLVISLIMVACRNGQ